MCKISKNNFNNWKLWLYLPNNSEILEYDL
jgi:hypothetical protein